MNRHPADRAQRRALRDKHGQKNKNNNAAYIHRTKAELEDEEFEHELKSFIRGEVSTPEGEEFDRDPSPIIVVDR